MLEGMPAEEVEELEAREERPVAVEAVGDIQGEGEARSLGVRVEQEN